MIKPNLFDVVELFVDTRERNLKKGEQGTIIKDYQDGFFEIEFCNNYGETLALCPIDKDKFIVVWDNQIITYKSVENNLSSIY